jgi:hypothetical protein
MLIAEWPIRLRYVWLRSGGSRGALWQQLERAIWHELALLATIVALVSALGAGIAGIEPMLAIAYLAGTMTGMAFSSYLGFSLRIEGTSTMTMSFLLFLIFTPVTWIILYRTLSGQWLWLYPVIGVFAALTLLCRWHARRRFLEVDWCAVRPQRPVNSPALRAREL